MEYTVYMWNDLFWGQTTLCLSTQLVHAKTITEALDIVERYAAVYTTETGTPVRFLTCGGYLRGI